MTGSRQPGHSEIANRLQRADGHLHSLLAIPEDRRRRLEIAQQPHASDVEQMISAFIGICGIVSRSTVGA